MLTHTLLRKSSVNPGTPSVGFVSDVPADREVCYHKVPYSVCFVFIAVSVFFFCFFFVTAYLQLSRSRFDLPCWVRASQSPPWYSPPPLFVSHPSPPSPAPVLIMIGIKCHINNLDEQSVVVHTHSPPHVPFSLYVLLSNDLYKSQGAVLCSAILSNTS